MYIKSNNVYKSWFTKGLANACKKKNNLYKNILLVNQRTQRKGKKNKLTNILRNAEKDHYSKLLQKHQHDIKETWKVLNSLIKKGAVISLSMIPLSVAIKSLQINQK